MGEKKIQTTTKTKTTTLVAWGLIVVGLALASYASFSPAASGFIRSFFGDFGRLASVLSGSCTLNSETDLRVTDMNTIGPGNPVNFTVRNFGSSGTSASTYVVIKFLKPKGQTDAETSVVYTDPSNQKWVSYFAGGNTLGILACSSWSGVSIGSLPSPLPLGLQNIMGYVDPPDVVSPANPNGAIPESIENNNTRLLEL